MMHCKTFRRWTTIQRPLLPCRPPKSCRPPKTPPPRHLPVFAGRLPLITSPPYTFYSNSSGKSGKSGKGLIFNDNFDHSSPTTRNLEWSMRYSRSCSRINFLKMGCRPVSLGRFSGNRSTTLEMTSAKPILQQLLKCYTITLRIGCPRHVSLRKSLILLSSSPVSLRNVSS